jgi:hypothetical protein
MAISRDLFLSILALDSYNRGYGAGISNLSDTDGTRLGTAGNPVTVHSFVSIHSNHFITRHAPLLPLRENVAGEA